MLANGLSRLPHVENVVEKDDDKEVQVVFTVEKEQLMEEWKDWLDDEWYGGIVYYRLFGELDDYRDEDGEPISKHRRHMIQRKSKSYRLLSHRRAGSTTTEENITGTRIQNASHDTTELSNQLVIV